jgi:hypothetical protein
VGESINRLSMKDHRPASAKSDFRILGARGLLIAGCVLVVLPSIAALAYATKRIAAEQAAYGGTSAPQCVPATLNRSAVLPGTQLSVSPLPDSLDSSPYTQISLLGVPAPHLHDLSVSGSLSGKHTGHLEPYSQGDGASFVPTTPFEPGETVTVAGKFTAGSSEQPFTFHFTVSHPDHITREDPSSQTPARPEGSSSDYQTFHSRPELNPPAVDVTAANPGMSPGDIFTAPYTGPGQHGPMIFESSGNLVWFDPLPPDTEATNLQVQEYEGKPVLTWWQGYIPPNGFGEGEEVIANTSYQQIAHVKAGNGYEADLHDFHIDPKNNTAVLTVFNPVYCNLSSLGGSPDAAVTDGVFQEIDLKTGLVRREWHSLDHVAMGESHSSPLQSTTEYPFDYFHINTVDPHEDGTTLISARNTWTLYELDSKTGQIVLRAGSKQGSVKMQNGTQTAYQHDATELPDGDISVFDNGGVPNVHPQTRGIIIQINPKSDTDTLISEFEHPTPLHSGSQGDMQPLPNGNFFFGWGAEPYFSEFTAAGELLFDAHMAPKDESYRSYRFQWTGTPTEVPAIAVSQSTTTTPVTVYASWNGATNVAGWRLMGGPSPDSLSVLTTAPRTGFETAIAVPLPTAYVLVQALNEAGEVLSTSRTIGA